MTADTKKVCRGVGACWPPIRRNRLSVRDIGKIPVDTRRLAHHQGVY